MSLYALPTVGRAGLGNGLFPWARAEIFAQRTNARVIAPQWTSFRIGPYLRREPEKRRYGGFFHAPHHVRGMHAAALRLFAPRITESAGAVPDVVVDPSSNRPMLVEFTGLDELFRPLVMHQAFIRDRLWEMTRPALRPTQEPYAGRFIAMHVRRGDITRQGFTPAELGGVNVFTPLAWFVGMARALRRVRITADIPVVVFTDGHPDEVRDLCRVERVFVHPREAAICDLWTMARAGALFASGHSTFGMWASFLGRMPTLYAPGKMQQRVQGDAAGALEAELAADDEIPRGVLERLGTVRRP